MTCMKLAAFTSDLPDDSIEDDHDIIQFSGQGVSRVIAQTLRDVGYLVQEPEHMGPSGWEFEVKGRHRLSLRISDLGDFFILQTFSDSFFPFFLRQKEEFELAVLRHIRAAFERDGRFHDLLWFGRIGDDYGFTDPLFGKVGAIGTKPPDAWNWRSWRE